MRRLLLAELALVVAAAGLASAATIYVKPDGTGDAPTIQAGVNMTVAGDTVLLASGTFAGSGNRNVIVPNRQITIRSETGDAGDCVMDCEGDTGFGRFALEFQSGSSYPRLEGVTITDANAAVGAVRCYSSPAIRNCVFLSNQAYQGGACYCSGTDVVIANCTFISNTALSGGSEDGGGAVFISGVMVNLLVDGCTFVGNSARAGGAIYCLMHEAWADIRNSVFYHNSATSYGGAIAVDMMAADIRGCTFFANSSPVGSGSALDVSRGVSVHNCIIAYGIGGYGYAWWDTDYDPYITCTDIYGNEGGDWVGRIAPCLGQDGNFSADPAFCQHEVEPYDLQLCDDSPCLPGNHPTGYNCGLIGALGQGCTCGPTGVVPKTWGAIKAFYR